MKSKKRLIQLLAITTLFGLWMFHAHSTEWSQWRGPNRNGISQETGLLKTWPEDGPKVLWRVPVGDGYSALSIAQDNLYTMETEEEGEFVTCLDTSSGDEVWLFQLDHGTRLDDIRHFLRRLPRWLKAHYNLNCLGQQLFDHPRQSICCLAIHCVDLVQ